MRKRVAWFSYFYYFRNNYKLEIAPSTHPFNNCIFELLPLTRLLPLYHSDPHWRFVSHDCYIQNVLKYHRTLLSTDQRKTLKTSFLRTLKRWKMNKCGIKCKQATWEFEKSQHLLFNTNKILSSNNIVFKYSNKTLNINVSFDRHFETIW